MKQPITPWKHIAPQSPDYPKSQLMKDAEDSPALWKKLVQMDIEATVMLKLFLHYDEKYDNEEEANEIYQWVFKMLDHPHRCEELDETLVEDARLKFVMYCTKNGIELVPKDTENKSK
jgi:L-fucose isomerase-like protein